MASADGWTSELARELADDALERFLRYVRFDTQSDPLSDSYPSTDKQLELLRVLAEELRAFGLDDAAVDEHGYVFATVPATVDRDVSTVGLIAHVDTSPDVSGAGVEPQVVRFEGESLPLAGDAAQKLDPADEPELANHVGHDIVTTDGTTLLGADDKAGVAEIMAAAAYLVRHPEIAHGPIRIGFTPDEEIGGGTTYFDVEAFGAEIAYTLDGSTAGELQDETFSALQATVEFHGRSAHPGRAKGQLVNAIKLAADFVSHLPREGLSPETTEERQGFVHPMRIEGGVERCAVTLILRDFDEQKLAGHEQLVRRVAEETAASDSHARVDVNVRRQYRNMREYVAEVPRALTVAEEAIRAEGLEPRRTSIRGGTDGSRLSERGLPTPNLFTGAHGHHSRHEWVCVRDLGSAAAAIVRLVELWAADENAGRPRK
jgi:tripeptide aminopeptidase